MVGEHPHTGVHVVCAWGVDVDECTLRKDKRKNLLVPVNVWMQMCCGKCRWLVNKGTQLCMWCRCG